MTTYAQNLEWMRETCICDGDWDDETGCALETPDDGVTVHRPIVSDRDFEWRICGRCRGEGELHGWPGAYTESDRAEWSDEDYEDYRSYRRSCEDCDGTGKVRELTDAALERPEVVEWLDDWRDTENTYRMERMMGA